MAKLSVGEWRILLLSDCLQDSEELYEYTECLRKEGKRAVLSITREDAKVLDEYLEDGQDNHFREQLRKEWVFTGKVKDNGKGNKTTCEYCQHQQIRYRYLCKNIKTGVYLDLGSVCVGYIVHGEEKMKDKEFSKNFVEGLDSLRKKPYVPDPQEVESKRRKQEPSIRYAASIIHSAGHGENSFFQSLQKQWNEGNSLSDKQFDALKNMAIRIRDSRKRKGVANNA
ncbi:hypothetical protein JL_190 [Bacillus phage JL]|uniref:Uncharacterized protein n=1 Tax=Bacillus phage JL TaxID=1296655 RepID=S5MST5_9CAUD|nr:hypothetical protein AVV47_gp106 [Bacillus phage JL]AGR46857.1 hypothetical protein JL_190 [Bacillus phage JL]